MFNNLKYLCLRKFSYVCQDRQFLKKFNNKFLSNLLESKN